MDGESFAAESNDAFKPAALGAGSLKKVAAPSTVLLVGFDQLGAKKFSYWLAERGEFAPLVRDSEDLRAILDGRGAAAALIAEEALSGPEELEVLLRAYPRIPILVGMLDFDRERADALLRAGASAVVRLVSATPEGLRAVLKLGAQRLLGSAPLRSDPLEGLSERLRDVAKRLAAGQSRKQIAAELFVAPATVKKYRQRIYRELGVTNPAELVAFVRQHETARAADRPASDTRLACRRLTSHHRNWARPSRLHMASALGVERWRLA